MQATMQAATAHTRPFPVYLSANEAFKGNYGKYLRWSMAAAVVLLGLLVWLMPRYQPAPYVLRGHIIEIFDLAESPAVIQEEKPVAAPPIVRNLEPVDELAETPGDFMETTRWQPWAPAPADPGEAGGEVFLPSSANPRLLFQAKPEYSQIARMSGLKGVVIVKVLVGPGGQVEDAQVIQGVHPILNQAALKAAYRCRFEAGTQRTVPVRAWVAVPYSFRLH